MATLSLWGCAGYRLWRGCWNYYQGTGCVLHSGKFGYVRLLNLITLQHMQIAKHLVLHKHRKVCNQMTVRETVSGGDTAT